MKLFIALLAGFFALVPAASAQDRIEVGKEAIKNGNFVKAIEELRDAVKKDKKNPQAYYWLGVACLKADSLDQSVAAFIQARELDTSNASIYEYLGDAYTAQKLPAAAIQQYKRASDIDTMNVPLLMKLADGSKKARMYTEAAAAYNQAIRLDSTNERALTDLSSLYMRGKQYQNAVRPLSVLARLQPANLEVQMSYLKALSETKDYPGIIPLGQHILTLSAESQEVKELLADAYIKTGNKDSAERIFGSVNPDSLDRDQLVVYAKVLKSQEQFEKATDMMERAYRKDTASCDVPYELGTLYMKLKKWKDAVSMFERKVACDTSAGFQFASHLNIAMCLMQQKEFKEARGHILAAIERRPESVQAWLTLAQDYAQLGDDSKKVESYQKVLDLACDLGCSWVLFDRDADELEELDRYDW